MMIEKRRSSAALCSPDCIPLGTVSLTGLRARVGITVRPGEISIAHQNSLLRVIRELRARLVSEPDLLDGHALVDVRLPSCEPGLSFRLDAACLVHCGPVREQQLQAQ